MTLLERALAAKIANREPPATVSHQEVEVLLAFIKGELTYGQFGTAVCVSKTNGAATHAVSLLRRAVQLGLVAVEASK